MSVQRRLPEDHPVMVAWNVYKATDDYNNTRRWAVFEAHVDGSLWAAFEQGYREGQRAAFDGEKPAAPPAPADVARPLDAARKQLLAMSIGGCTCGVKTFQLQWHDVTCRYRQAQECLENVEQAAVALTAQAARVEQLERVLAPFTKYYDLNDCHERDDDDVLEVPVRDLRAAAALAAPETPASGEGDAP